MSKGSKRIPADVSDALVTINWTLIYGDIDDEERERLKRERDRLTEKGRDEQ